MDILFENACIVTMDDEAPYLENAYIAVTGKKIEYVGAKKPEGKAVRTIDARGKVIMPGFVNTHTHIPMTLFRGLSDDCELNDWLFNHIFPAEDRLTAEKVQAGSALAICEMLASGTTSFSDSYFFTDAIFDVTLSSGIKANLSRSIVGNGDGFETLPSVLEMESLISRAKNLGEGRVRADISIHAEYTSETACRQKVAEYARKNGLILQIHTSETKSEHENCKKKYGRTPTEQFEHEGLFENTRPLLAHCCYMTETDMDILKRNNGSVAHCPCSNLKLASGVAPVLTMRSHGLNVTLGTDGVASNNNTDMLEEIKLFAILHKGVNNNPTAINAMTALSAATRNGAIAQGRDDSGVIKEGYAADIIMIDFDRPHLTPSYSAASNIVYAANGSDVVMTMVDGKVLYENGEFTTLDVEKIKNDVKKLICV